MVFHWSLSDYKSPQVSRTLLSILVNLNSSIVWMVCTCILISNSFSLFTNPSVTVPCTLIVIGITVTFMFHDFFSSHFSPSFNFTQWPAKMAKSLIRQVICFSLTITKSGCLLSKSQRILCILFSRMDSRLCIYHLFMWSNLNFWHSSQLITFLTQSCLLSNSLHAIMLHSLIMWLTISSLSPYNLHLLFCWVLSILTLI